MQQYHLVGYIDTGYCDSFYEDSGDCLVIQDEQNKIVLAEFFEENLNNKEVSIKYYISDEKFSTEEIEEKFIKKISGMVDASIYPVYSDVTGYLWTHEEIGVNGHDLFKELCSYDGKYIDMVIDVKEE